MDKCEEFNSIYARTNILVDAMKTKSGMFIPNFETQDGIEIRSLHDAIFPATKKTKSDLCDCAIKAPVHTIGYHDAIVEAGGFDGK